MSPQRRRPTGGIVCKGSHPERRCHCASAGRWRPRAEVMEMPEFSRKYTIMPHPALASTVLAVAVLAASACASSAAPPAVAHASHRAYYEVGIGHVSARADVVGARGGMVAEWSRDCEGWTSNQRLAVSMSQSSGEAVSSSVSLSSFESLDGTLYRFEARTEIGGETIEEVRGKAERPARSEPGIAAHQAPAGTH